MNPELPQTNQPERQPPSKRPDLTLLGIGIGFFAFLAILISNTLPALRELRKRENLASTYEDTVQRLRKELAREQRYLRAVQSDPDVIRGLWLQRNPADDEKVLDPRQTQPPKWWSTVWRPNPEATREPEQATPREAQHPQRRPRMMVRLPPLLPFPRAHLPHHLRAMSWPPGRLQMP